MKRNIKTKAKQIKTDEIFPIVGYKKKIKMKKIKVHQIKVVKIL